MRPLLLLGAIAVLLGTAACARTGESRIIACTSAEPPHVVPRPQIIEPDGCTYPDNPIDARIVPRPAGSAPDAYAIDVDPDAIHLRASSAAGMFYARQTLEQLSTWQNGHVLTPGMHIQDWPRYRWRGVHLDVARHYFDVATLQKFIDVAAHYKLNVVHLHFTDNEAWRLPSTKFPRLPSTPHYTTAQIGDIVRYARQRYIRIVPEVDLPGHSGAAIRAYPALACGSPDTLCPARAYAFARDALREAAALFPKGTPVHTGGDEVTGWTTQQRRQLFSGLAHDADPMVVWDDEADVAPQNAVVMVWHLGDALSMAAVRGRRIITAQDGPLYFNAAQGDATQEPPASKYTTTLEQVYAYDPAAPPVAGVEATLWTEKIATPARLWYMLLPRELALAEIAWTAPDQKNWHRFRAALPAQFDWLAAHGYAFRVPNVAIDALSKRARYASVKGEPNAAQLTTAFPVRLKLDGAVAGSSIAYRINGGLWQRYDAPVSLKRAGTVEARQTVDGRTSAVTSLLVLGHAVPLASHSFDAVVSP